MSALDHYAEQEQLSAIGRLQDENCALLRHALALMDHPAGIAGAALFFVWISLLVSA